jgi:hypothetical protein
MLLLSLSTLDRNRCDILFERERDQEDVCLIMWVRWKMKVIPEWNHELIKMRPIASSFRFLK